MKENEKNPFPRKVLPMKKIDSESLLDGRKEIIIVHQGEEYRLRQTKNGRLLLTK